MTDKQAKSTASLAPEIIETGDVPFTTLALPIETEILVDLARRRGYTQVVDYVLALIDRDDEALWDEQFAASQGALADMARAALAEDEAGLTDDLELD